MVKHLQITFKEREKVECGRTLHTVGYTQRDNHSAIVGVRGKGTFKGSVPGDFFPRSASTSDVRAAASDMLRPTQTKHVSNFQTTPSFFFRSV